MMQDLYKGWKMVYQTYLSGDIRKIMYYYLTACIITLGGVYFYLIWQGYISFAVIFSSLVGVLPQTETPPITITGAVGIIFIIRYIIMGVFDNLKPSNIEERLHAVEDKVNDLHKLAFDDVDIDLSLNEKPKNKEGGEVGKTQSAKSRKSA
jgi:hypothetical protein